MNICDFHHERVVHQGRECPLCRKNQEIIDLKLEINELRIINIEQEMTIERLNYERHTNNKTARINN